MAETCDSNFTVKDENCLDIGLGGKPFRLKFLHFGFHRYYKIPFLEAARLIESYITAERSACNYLVNKINVDHWLTSFWSEWLAGVKPPTQIEWHVPMSSLKWATERYKQKNYKDAEAYLSNAIHEYKVVHEKWINYRAGLVFGGKRAITIINYSIEVLITAATVGTGAGLTTAIKAGTYTRRAASVKAAAFAAGMTTYKDSMSGIGNYAYLDEKIEVWKIALNAGQSFVLSLVGGKLAEKFFSKLKPYVNESIINDSKALELAIKHKLLPFGYKSNFLPQQLFSDFITGAGLNIITEAVKKAALKSKGKKITFSDFITIVVDQLRNESWATIFKLWVAKGKKL